MIVTLSSRGKELAERWWAAVHSSPPPMEYYPPGSTNLRPDSPYSYAVDLLLFLAGYLSEGAEVATLTAAYDSQLQGVYFAVRRRFGFSYFQTAMAFEALVSTDCLEGVEGKWQGRWTTVREMLVALAQQKRFKLFLYLCERQPRSIRELSDKLGCSQELTRHHAKVLVSTGLLSVAEGIMGPVYETDLWAVSFLSQSLRLLVGLPL